MESANFLNAQFLGNPISAYLLVAAVGLVLILSLKVVEWVVIRKIRKLAGKTDYKLIGFLVDQVEDRLIPALYATALYFSLMQLHLPATPQKALNALWVIFISFQMIQLAIASLIFFLEEVWLPKRDDQEHKGAFRSILSVARIAVWGIGVVFVLDNLGFNVSAIVAGLGITGVAVALAAQTILGDLFNYFVIFFDKPFELGDAISVDGFTGKVEHIGIKTTRIRSAEGEQIIIPNTSLTSSRVKNFKRMVERRAVANLGLVYETPSQKLTQIPDLLKRIVVEIGETRFDRAHFRDYGTFSLNFELVYFVQTADYGAYMDTVQKINFRIKDEFEKLGLEFAYPTSVQYAKQTS